MDIGSLRPVVTGVTAPVPKAPAATDQATDTDLPVQQTVTETGESANDGDTFSDTGNDKEQSGYNNTNLRSTVMLDESTRSLIFRTIDPATGEVVSQVPEESKLRFREMLTSWSNRSDGTTGNQSYA